ncbi:hypothetical protein D3C84_1131550 [compost metagenome]
MRGDIGLLGRGVIARDRPQHTQLRAQLSLQGKQRGREAIDIQHEHLDEVLRGLQLAVVIYQRDLLFEGVQPKLQRLEVAWGNAGGRGNRPGH